MVDLSKVSDDAVGNDYKRFMKMNSFNNMPASTYNSVSFLASKFEEEDDDDDFEDEDEDIFDEEDLVEEEGYEEDFDFEEEEESVEDDEDLGKYN